MKVTIAANVFQIFGFICDRELTGNELAKATFPFGGRVQNKPNNPVYLNNVRPEIQVIPVHIPGP